ncbi:hypothetical protein RvY_16502 [Ramazzottius varieornatus]|uniref:Uncharacterized protein n=1 Tax=Ramazzottius varieornatus TaxID=947166 RepID=A0A1D1W1G4_RAMVA|nr:hypothetical protein RvY_16502 [Ramazzottius varieornatus]
MVPDKVNKHAGGYRGVGLQLLEFEKTSSRRYPPTGTAAEFEAPEDSNSTSVDYLAVSRLSDKSLRSAQPDALPVEQEDQH